MHPRAKNKRGGNRTGESNTNCPMTRTYCMVVFILNKTSDVPRVTDENSLRFSARDILVPNFSASIDQSLCGYTIPHGAHFVRWSMPRFISTLRLKLPLPSRPLSKAFPIRLETLSFHLLAMRVGGRRVREVQHILRAIDAANIVSVTGAIATA